jgi:arginyl-tRNA--protein-N-Asp/Glu arginylyltransferase
MTFLRDLPPLPQLQFYATAPYRCAYLPGCTARSQVAVPDHLIDQATYTTLVHSGFRRSGLYTYRPWCDSCQACIPLRVRTAEFAPSRSQRRAWIRHAHLTASTSALIFSEEHFALYQRYQSARHEGGGMDKDDGEQYAQFLLRSHTDSALIEFRENGQLRIVSVIDKLRDGLSSVYTFFDPDIPRACYGIYAILWQIAYCRDRGLPHLYLGYWIVDSQKMRYKNHFQPAQIYQQGRWCAAPSPLTQEV